MVGSISLVPSYVSGLRSPDGVCLSAVSLVRAFSQHPLFVLGLMQLPGCSHGDMSEDHGPTLCTEHAAESDVPNTPAQFEYASTAASYQAHVVRCIKTRLHARALQAGVHASSAVQKVGAELVARQAVVHAALASTHKRITKILLRCHEAVTVIASQSTALSDWIEAVLLDTELSSSSLSAALTAFAFSQRHMYDTASSRARLNIVSLRFRPLTVVQQDAVTCGLRIRLGTRLRFHPPQAPCATQAVVDVGQTGSRFMDIQCLSVAVSPADEYVAVSRSDHTVSVFALHSGRGTAVHCVTFGRPGQGLAQFGLPARICFTVAGHILVGENYNHRVQEVTVAGAHVRFVGTGIVDSRVGGLAANHKFIVVAKQFLCLSDFVFIFDAVTGALLQSFGENSMDPHRKCYGFCAAARLTPDSNSVYILETNGHAMGRISMLSVATGAHVGEVAPGRHSDFNRACDFEPVSDAGDVLVCNAPACTVSLYSGDGALSGWSRQCRLDCYAVSKDSSGCDGRRVFPCGIALHDDVLFILQGNSLLKIDI